VQITALLRGAAEKIVGLDTGYLGQQILKPGEDCPFRVHILLTKGSPTHFTVYTNALPVRP
jgi:hypothetical protein